MWLYFIYRWITHFSKPTIKRLIIRRLRQKKEDPKRYKERLGFKNKNQLTTQPVIWIHGVSAGEIRAALSLALALKENGYKDNILLTYTTRTAAELVKRQTLINPDYIKEAYIPFDSVEYIQRFLHTWNIKMAIFVESEMWPNILYELHKRHIPCLLISVRFGVKTKRNFSLLPKSVKKLFFQWFVAIYPVNNMLKTWLEQWNKVEDPIQLKYATPPLFYKQDQRDKMLDKLKYRIYWIAACTHESDEEYIIQTHQRLKQLFPSILTILAPRHIDRIPTIIQHLPKTYEFARFSESWPKDNTQFYIIDQYDQLGLIYALQGIVYLGGGLAHHGGHNPIEPAQLGNAIIVGSDSINNQDIVNLLKEHQAIIQLGDKNPILMSNHSILNPQPLDDIDSEKSYKSIKKHHIYDHHMILNQLFNTILTLIKDPQYKHDLIKRTIRVSKNSKKYRKNIAHKIMAHYPSTHHNNPNVP